MQQCYPVAQKQLLQSIRFSFYGKLNPPSRTRTHNMERHDECEVRYRKLVGRCDVFVASLCYALTWAGIVGCVMKAHTEKLYNAPRLYRGQKTCFSATAL